MNRKFQSIQSTLVERGLIKKPKKVDKETSNTASQSPLNIKNNKDTCQIVEEILLEKQCNYVLLTYNQFQTSNLRKSDAYQNFHVLTAKNSKHHVGWLNYVFSGHCSVEKGSLQFCTAKETSQLYKHSERHNEKCEQPTFHKLSNDGKKVLKEAAAKAATMDTLALSFCYPKSSFLTIAKALVEIGQRHPVSAILDVKDALPSVNTVRSSITSMTSSGRLHIRYEFIPKLCVLVAV